MTQLAKVQEPSMEEILASIRRIIADDETKPPGSEQASSPEPGARPEKSDAAAPPPRLPVMKDFPLSANPAAARAAPAPVAPVSEPVAEPEGSDSQDDIDAMLAGLDEATSATQIRPSLPDGEVFELTDEMALPDAPPPVLHRIELEDDLEFTETVAPRAVHRQPVFEPPPLESVAPPPPPPQMLSRSTVSAVESAFNTLANTVLSNNARTLEDLVREMLRPMLKSWLDDNLPGLVERIVKAEIERVSRGR
jgi:uncharacterized protein